MSRNWVQPKPGPAFTGRQKSQPLPLDALARADFPSDTDMYLDINAMVAGDRFANEEREKARAELPRSNIVFNGIVGWHQL